MTVDYQDGVAISQLIIYIPCLFLAVLLTFRHGIRRSSSWYFIALFTLIRITGACCLLATISRRTNIGLYTTAIICSAIGLSPLILTCLALLSRANRSSERNIGEKTPSPSETVLQPLVFHILTILTFAALILCIVGGVLSSKSTATLGRISTSTKVGVIIFIVAWVGLCALLAIMAINSSCIRKGERRLIIAVAISVPFILVRLIYSTILSFAHNPRFSLISGSVTINLVMAVLEEYVVVIVCLAIGLTLQVQSTRNSYVNADVVQGSDNPARVAHERERESSVLGQKRNWSGGPITWLVRRALELRRS